MNFALRGALQIDNEHDFYQSSFLKEKQSTKKKVRAFFFLGKTSKDLFDIRRCIR
jgi:hypothetical protein